MATAGRLCEPTWDLGGIIFLVLWLCAAHDFTSALDFILLPKLWDDFGENADKVRLSVGLQMSKHLFTPQQRLLLRGEGNRVWQARLPCWWPTGAAHLLQQRPRIDLGY